MYTKAGIQAIKSMTVWGNYSSQYTTIPMFPSSSIRNTANGERWISYVNGNLINSLSFVTNQNSGIVLGSGTTAPTENDYHLETQITSGIAVTVSGITRGVDSSDRLYMEVTLNVSNTSSSDITIAEVGLVSGNIMCASSSTSSSVGANNVMIDRTLLDSPVTIIPSGSAAIKYRIISDMTFS